jgi:hypothetical protein
MRRPLYRPTVLQTVCLTAIAAAALAYGFAMRYWVVENATIGIGCEGTTTSWLCSSRHATLVLFRVQAFGVAALGVALLNLIRPNIALWAIALATAGVGIVLYNVGLSALAVALLILSLARPAPEAG